MLEYANYVEQAKAAKLEGLSAPAAPFKKWSYGWHDMDQTATIVHTTNLMIEPLFPSSTLSHISWEVNELAAAKGVVAAKTCLNKGCTSETRNMPPI